MILILMKMVIFITKQQEIKQMIPDKETTTSNEQIITISDYYYKKTEIDTMMNGKANTSHTHSIATLETDGFLFM